MATYSVTYQNPNVAEPTTDQIEADRWATTNDFIWFYRTESDKEEVVFAVSTEWIGLIRRAENGDSNGKAGHPTA